MKTSMLTAIGLAFLVALSPLHAQDGGQEQKSGDDLDALLWSPPGQGDETQQTSPAPAPQAQSGGSQPAGSEPGTAESDTATAAPASEEQKTAAPKASRSRLVEEIIVSAQKREENLQDVPISMQAFSADMLDAKGIDDPKALQLSTPGLQYNFLAGYSIIYMRGVGSDAFIPSADASVATYIDGIYYPFNQGLAQSFGALERVEILKGPQGTLFGRNSTGGAINVITKKPSLSEPGADVQVSYGDYNQVYTRVHVNLPVHETLALALSGIYNNEDNYYTLVPTQTHPFLPPEVTKGYRLKVRWAPIDDLDVILSSSRIHPTGSLAQELVGRDLKPLTIALGAQLVPGKGAVEQPDYVDGSDLPVFNSNRTNVDAVDAKYTTPWFDMRFIGAQQGISSDSNADYDGTNAPIASFHAPGQFADIKTGEIQFISNAESWGSEWLTWIGGIYGIKSSAGFDPLLFTSNINTETTLVLHGILDTESTSYFAQSTADITDWFALTLGARFVSETRAMVRSDTNSLNPDGSQTRLRTWNPREKKSSNLSPKVTLDFKPWDGNMFYVGYTKGFKSGTFNIINIYQDTQYIPPEVVTAYEAGYKGELLDGYMRLNTAIFQNGIKDLQVQTISLQSGGAVRFESAGGAEIKGAEFDLTWELLPNLVPGLVLTAGGSYLEGKYTDYTNGSGFDPTTGQFQENLDFTGNKTLRTPEFSGNAGLNYNFDLGPGNLEIAGDIYHNSGFFYSAQNKDSVAEKAYDVVNARMSYLYNPWNLRVTAFGKNINNGKYHYVMFENDFSTWKTLAPPATYGVRLNWNF